MTHGYKFELFILELSFLGWYLLGSLIIFGAYFVHPYLEATIAEAYISLKGEPEIETSSDDFEKLKGDFSSYPNTINGNVKLDSSYSKTGDNSLEDLKSRGKFILGLDASFPPMGYVNDANEIVGYDIDLAKEVAKRMGVDFVAQPIDWDAKEMELKTGKIDCIWNGMTISEDVKANCSVSKAYVKNAQVVVMKSSALADYATAGSLEGLEFAVESGSAGEEAAKENNLTYTAVLTQADALKEVKSGAADACIIDITMANAMTGKTSLRAFQRAVGCCETVAELV